MELQLPFSVTTFSVFLIFLFYALKLITLFRGSDPVNTTTKSPPGPWKLPLIGSMHHLAGSLPHHTLRDLSRRYGPMMHLQLGEISAIVISSPQMAKEVMKTHDLAFANRPALLAANIIAYDRENIAFAPYGNYWRQMRKICILELLSAKNVRSFSFILDDEVYQIIESIRSSGGSPINFSKYIFSLTNVVVSRATFGQRCEDEDVLIALIKEAHTLAGGFDVSDLFPSLTLLHVLSRIKPRLVSLHRKIDVILENIISKHKDRNERLRAAGNEELRDEDLLDVLLRLQGSDEIDFPITTKNVKAVILDMFAAGTDTSSSTVEWAMSELMRNQKAMEKAQAEVRSGFKGKKTIKGSHVEGLNFLKWVIKETLRLHPPLPLLLPRECTKRCEIGGYDIPVKTKIIVNAWALGRDSDYWADAESFLPERFAENPVDFTGNDFEYIPFGAGRRMCPGMSFGLSNVEFPLAQLLYHFNWKLPDGMKPEDLDMTETAGSTAGRRNHLYQVATPYDPSG